jgi:hypothetical protein
MTNAANKRAKPKVPNAMVFWDPAPVKVEGLAEAAVPLVDEVATASVVLAAVVILGATDTVVPAGAGVAVPTTRAAAAVFDPVIVWNTTCGTVTTVEMTVVRLDEAMTKPALAPVVSVQGTTTVVKTSIVVTGIIRV